MTLPDDATLSGTLVTDDRLSVPPTTFWMQQSGLATGRNFVDATDHATVSFSVDGVYPLRLTADDRVLQGTDTVRITVNASN